MTESSTENFIRTHVPNLAHCKKLNISVESVGEQSVVLKLPYSEQIIGNPETKVIHGGALTTLLDTACGFASVASIFNNAGILCPTLDLRIDYMHSATPKKSVIGRAETYRIANNIIFVRGMAFHQDSEESPIAYCTATFMRLTPTN
jgi:uncharacterized protein (TIGR00369 family)